MYYDSMSVDILLDSSSFGGIETHVYELASGLYKQGIDVRVVFYCDHGEHPLRDRLHAKGMMTVMLDGTMSSLGNYLKHRNPSIVHTHGYKAGIIGRLLCRWHGIAIVSTYHAGEIPSGKLAVYDWLDRSTSWLADKVYAVSDLIAGRLSPRTEVIRNFIDTSASHASRGEHVAFVGRLSHEKGPDLFVSAARLMPGITFHVYGDGPMMKELTMIAPGNVIFHGHRSNMSSTWDEISLLVMPSRYEGLPMAALEAMSKGIPVISNRVGAMDKLISDGGNGWILDSLDPYRYAEKVNQWLQLDEVSRKRIRKSAMRTIDDGYSTTAIIPQLLDDYRSLRPHFKAHRILHNIR